MNTIDIYIYLHCTSTFCSSSIKVYVFAKISNFLSFFEVLNDFDLIETEIKKNLCMCKQKFDICRPVLKNVCADFKHFEVIR